MTRFKAVIFDVDGTLAETEEVHRAAFNDAFVHFGLDWNWDRDLYRELLKVTGGKERIRHRAEQLGIDPSDLAAIKIADIHAFKTERYAKMVAAGKCELRTGVESAIRGARRMGLRLAIATTTSHPNVDALLAATLGLDAKPMFDAIVAGDDVPHKKPAPDVYEAVLARLHLPASLCLAVEDSANGVASARAAGIEVWVTPSLYTNHESFEGAGRVLTDLSNFQQLIQGSMPATPLCKTRGSKASRSSG